MLVLSRKPGESLVIGGNVTVTIVETKGGRVRVGIDAPKDLPVHRAEVRQRIEIERIEIERIEIERTEIERTEIERTEIERTEIESRTEGVMTY